MKLSFVIPCYRSENTIEAVVKEIETVVSERINIEYEIIMVDDCSPDLVWNKICQMADNNNRIKGISLARNFGQHAALLAGYALCSGDYVISLDDDGQTPLESTFDLVDKLEEGYDAVYAYYNEKKQSPFRIFGSWMANEMGKRILGQPKGFHGSSFYITKKFVIDEMIKYNNPYPYLLGLLLQVTRKIAWIETKHRARKQGRSGYSIKSLLSLWLNGFTAFSTKPLEWGLIVGVILSLLGILYSIFIVIRVLLGFPYSAGWSSLIVASLFGDGVILIMLGLVGEYIGRIYICINNSPQYVFLKTTGCYEKGVKIWGTVKDESTR